MGGRGGRELESVRLVTKLVLHKPSIAFDISSSDQRDGSTFSAANIKTKND